MSSRTTISMSKVCLTVAGLRCAPKELVLPSSLGYLALGVGPCSVSGTGEMQGFAMLLKKSREGRTRRSLRTDYFGISRLQATWR